MECAGNGNGNDGSPPPFLSKTYDMVDDQSTDSVVSWSHSGKSFVVWNPPEFARLLLPKYFKHTNFSSFVRQLNTYGFRKVDPDRWEFANEGFLRGQKHMLKAISRRKPTHSHASRQPTQGQGVPLGACVEVGNFGGLDEELECLKRDKNVLMQEVVRLRQQQQATDHQVLNLIQRIQGMENKQQNMMSFLAKAMQSPAFLTQFVQQSEGGGQIEGDSGNHGVRGVNGPRRMVTAKKKRRIPRDEVDMDRQDEQMIPEDNQMLKYSPPRGSRKSILMQMLHTNSSHFPSSPDHTYPVDSVPLPANDPENGCPSRQNSCLTSAEMNQTTGLDYIRAPTAGFRDVSASAVVSGMQSPSSTPEMVGNQMHHLPDANLEFSPLHTVPGLPCMSPPAVPNTNNGGVNLVNGAKYGASKVGVDYINHIAADASIPLEPEQFSCAADTDDFFEGMPMLLPDMSEFSWDRLPSGASTSDDVDDVQSSTHDSLSNETVFNPAAIRESEWDTASMEQLTHQMGFLASTLNC